MTVKGQHVVVTGASRGLGRAVAEAFLAAGARVCGTGRDPEALEETRSRLEAIGGDFELVTLDVRHEESVCDLMQRLDRLDIVVNNAGIARIKPLLDTATEELCQTFSVNVVGAFVVMREAARRMVASGGGLIVNIASDAAIRGIPRMAPYVASKHALLGMGRSASLELRGSGVRVTTFCPGPIATDILGPGTASPNAMTCKSLAELIVSIASLPPNAELQELLIQPSPVVS
ncbi:SDR family oxidoreductase [Candidatus Poribacteria bacterium]|nr:SDR family oxidoreductase [Candidatus Poribacteria bacterium]